MRTRLGIIKSLGILILAGIGLGLPMPTAAQSTLPSSSAASAMLISSSEPGRQAIYVKDPSGQLTLAAECKCPFRPSVSLSGSRVVFRVVQPDGTSAAYYKDAPFSGDAVRIDAGADSAADGASISTPALSGNGQFVVFSSTANLDAATDDTVGTADLFIRDLSSGVTERLTIGARLTGNPSISADGRYIAFATASQLAVEDVNNVGDVYLIDRAKSDSALRLLTAPALNAAATDAAISAGGSAVAFTSAADNLVAEDANGLADVFVVDLRAGTTTRVSAPLDSTGTSPASKFLGISGNGRRVAFAAAGGLFVRDLTSGETWPVSATADQSVDLASDGRTVLVSSAAADDVLVNQLPPDVPAGSAVRGDPFDPVAGQNPITVVFSTVASAGNIDLSIRSAGPAVSEGFTTTAPYFVVSSDVTSTSGLLVCVNDVEAAGLRLLHLTGGGWTDITTSDRITEASICGSTSSLGTFVLASVVPDDDAGSPPKEKKSAGVSNVVSWNVDADGFWDVGTNWSGGVVPGDGDTVIIDRPAGNFVITVRNPTANVGSLSANEQINVTSVLTIAGTGSFNGGLFLFGNLTGTGTAVLNSNSVWQANTDTIISLAGGVDVQATRTLTITATGNQLHYLDAAPLRNHGTVLWTSGPLVIRNGTAVVNDAGKLWQVQGDLVLLADGSGTPTFTNAGIFQRTAGAGDLNMTGSSLFAFTNNGTFDLQTGMFNVLAGSLTNSGLVQLGAGTTFRLDRVTFLSTSTFAGTGTLHANGITTITGDVAVTAPLLITANVTGTGPLRLAAATTWHANTDTIISVAGGLDVQPGKTLTISASGNQSHYLDAAPLRNHGTVLWTSGPLVIRNGTAVVNDAGKLWQVQGDLVLLADGSGTPTFTNAGIFQRTAGAGDLNMTGSSLFAFTNNGTFDLQTGTFNVLAGTLTNSGLMQVGAGTTFKLDRVTLLASSTFAGTGALHANGITTITGDVAVTAPLLITANVTGTGPLRLAAATTWHANTDTIISVAGGLDVQPGKTLTISASGNQSHYLDAAPLRNHGTVLWTSGPLVIRNGTAVVNDAGKLWQVQGDLVLLADGSGTPTFTNAGIFQRTAGAGDLNMTGSSLFAFTNNGTFDLQTGTFNVLAGSLTNSGLVQLGAGTTFRLDRVTFLSTSTFAGTGTLHANGITTITGDVAVTAPLLITANVTGTGPLRLAAATTWHANTDTIISVAGGLDVQPGKTLTISASGNQSHYLDAAPLRNHGTVLWTSGPLVIRNGTAVVNDAGKLWQVQGDLVLLADGSGTPTFTNAGIFQRTAGAGDLNMTGSSLFAFTNNGTFDLQTGTFNVLAGTLTNSGLMQVGAGTTFKLDRVTLLASSTFAGTGTLHANGTTTLTGDITVTVPLLITGTLTGSGPLRLGAATTWQANGATIIEVAGGVDVQPAKTLTISAFGNQTHYLFDSALRNHGTVLWNSGPLHLRNSSSMVNEPGGVLDVQTSASLTFDGSGSPTFVNNGILQRSGPPNRLTVTAPFTNTGTFDVRIGGAGAGQLDEFGGNVVNLGGTLSAHLINGLTPGPADQFKIIDYGTLAGSFATLMGDGFTFNVCSAPNALFVCTVGAKITPTITWNNPADIFFGTALSGTQLNATASVPGTFVYSPLAGTILNAGNNQLLQTTFTPTDIAHYNTATGSAHINVLRANTTTTLQVLPGTTGFLQADALIAMVAPVAPGAGAPAGTVQFMDGATLIGSGTVSGGQAYILANGLASGVHSLTAVYAGNSNFVGSASPSGTATVRPITSSTFTFLTTTRQAVGLPATLRAKVIQFGGGTPTGTVQFSEGSTILGSAPLVSLGPGGVGSVATLDTTAIPAGTHLLIAKYSGNATLAKSVSPPAAITIYPGAPPAATAVTVVVSPSPSILGQPVTYTATVIGGATTGNVIVYVDGLFQGVAPIANVGGSFKATLTLPTAVLSTGTHVVSALYAGSVGFASSSSPPAVLMIQASPSLTEEAMPSVDEVSSLIELK